MLRSQARLVPLELNGERIVALLDTGAERSALGVEATARCGLGELVDDSFTRRVGGFGGATDGCGRVHYCEMIVGGVPFRAAFDVLRFPANVEFEAIIGLDFLVRGRASIAAEGTLTLHNHDGTPASVELLFPRENDALEAGREAAAVESVKGGGGASCVRPTTGETCPSTPRNARRSSLPDRKNRRPARCSPARPSSTRASHSRASSLEPASGERASEAPRSVQVVLPGQPAPKEQDQGEGVEPEFEHVDLASLSSPRAARRSTRAAGIGGGPNGSFELLHRYGRAGTEGDATQRETPT